MALTLIFKLGEEIYGLEIDAIQEIIEDPPLYYVPHAKGVLTGAINFHGQILAVIDLPALLGFEVVEHDHRRVVLSPEFKSLVLMVSDIQRIVKLDLSALQPSPKNQAGRAIRGLIELDEIMIKLLDTDAVINLLNK